MGGWEPEEEPEEGQGFGAEEPPEESELPGGEDDFDDLPETRLSDADYDRFVSEELDSRGRPRGDPPVTWILLGLTAAILLAWALFFR